MRCASVRMPPPGAVCQRLELVRSCDAGDLSDRERDEGMAVQPRRKGAFLQKKEDWGIFSSTWGNKALGFSRQVCSGLISLYSQLPNLRFVA